MCWAIKHSWHIVLGVQLILVRTHQLTCQYPQKGTVFCTIVVLQAFGVLICTSFAELMTGGSSVATASVRGANSTTVLITKTERVNEIFICLNAPIYSVPLIIRTEGYVLWQFMLYP